MPPERLALYTAFHANLDFSAMPSVDAAVVVERCYWPLLELAGRGFPLGLEMPVRTLETVGELDAEWIKTLRAGSRGKTAAPLSPPRTRPAKLVRLRRPRGR